MILGLLHTARPRKPRQRRTRQRMKVLEPSNTGLTERATARSIHAEPMPRSERVAFVNAPITAVFDYVDDPARFASHMNQSSWRMGGGSMTFQFDEGGGSKVGSHIRLSGRILDISLFLDAVVTQRTPPTFKVWETCSEPQLLVIGRYRMGFELTPEPEGTLLRVFLHYALPSKWAFRWLSRIFGQYYADWCTRRMVADGESLRSAIKAAGYMRERIMTNAQETDRTGSRAKWVFIGFMLIAFYFALSEHRAHLSGLLQYLPLLLLLACPLMHIFMHGHHGRHRHSDRHNGETSPRSEKS